MLSPGFSLRLIRQKHRLDLIQRIGKLRLKKYKML